MTFVPRAWSDAELQGKSIVSLDVLKLPTFADAFAPLYRAAVNDNAMRRKAA